MGDKHGASRRVPFVNAKWFFPSWMLAGSRPGGRGTFFCVAKSKYPKKRRPYKAPCGVEQGIRITCDPPAQRFALASANSFAHNGKRNELAALAGRIALTGTRRAASCGRLSLLTFFGEAKKVSSRRAEGVCACKRKPFRRRIACDPNSLLPPPATIHERKTVLRFRRSAYREKRCLLAKLQPCFPPTPA